MNYQERKEQLESGIAEHQQKIAKYRQAINQLLAAIEQKRGAIALIEELEEEQEEGEE